MLLTNLQNSVQLRGRLRSLVPPYHGKRVSPHPAVCRIEVSSRQSRDRFPKTQGYSSNSHKLSLITQYPFQRLEPRLVRLEIIVLIPFRFNSSDAFETLERVVK